MPCAPRIRPNNWQSWVRRMPAPSRSEQRIFLKHITGLSDADLIITPAPILTAEQDQLLQEMVKRRQDGEPVSKIIGEREFYSLPFFVNRHVLDPRPDSEILVEVGLSHIREKDSPHVLELGCGSGCIGVAMAANHQQCRVDMVDISTEALDVAHSNVTRHQLQDRVKLWRSDWFDTVQGRYDLILSNPPYIESHVIESLQIEVKNHDPILALDGGDDGLNPYRIIFSQAASHLYPQGVLAVEHGKGQEGELQRLMNSYGFAMIRSFPDLGGTNRVLVGRL